MAMPHLPHAGAAGADEAGADEAGADEAGADEAADPLLTLLPQAASNRVTPVAAVRPNLPDANLMRTSLRRRPLR